MKATWWFQRFSDFSERDFLTREDSTHTYGDLSSEIQRCHTLFRESGIRAGDVVALHGDYTLNGIAALFALFGLAAIVAPISGVSKEENSKREQSIDALWRVRTEESVHIEKIGVPTRSHEYVTRLRELEHAGLVLFSSGSSGVPKAMVHDIKSFLDPFSRKRPRRLCILIFLLYDHIGGLNTLFNGMATGAKIVVPQSRDPNIVAKAIQEHRVKLLPASPTFLNILLLSGAHKSFDLSSLRFVTYGTEPMPESLLTRLNREFPDTAFIQTFGTSETGISQTISRSSKSNLIKFDDPASEYKIVDGELWIRSKSQILGYLNHEMSRFTPDGWFMTGDLVKEADEGFLLIVGRRVELINVGGEKVTPSEVESVIMETPGVADCLVYGQENVITGQHVAAKVVANKDYDPKMLKRSIKQYCRKRLAPYKVPARITFTQEAIFSSRYKKVRTDNNAGTCPWRPS